MTWPNHIAGGIAFTGAVAAIWDYNVFASPEILLITIVASCLPDIDHTASPIGFICYPLAKWLSDNYGHRTITHGLPCTIALSCLYALGEHSLFGNYNTVVFFFLAYLSHLLWDGLTMQGIPLFYPFSSTDWHWMENEDYRLTVKDFKNEAVFMSVSILCIALMQPLYAQGFWTSYNRAFDTLDHTAREFNRSKDLLMVHCKIQQGSEIFQDSGSCIEASDNKLVLYRDKFVVYNQPEIKVIAATPTHTTKIWKKEKCIFVGVSLDSLLVLLDKMPIMNLQLQASETVDFSTGLFVQSASSWKGDYVNQLKVQPKPATPVQIQKPNYTTINTINAQIQLLQSNYQKEVKKYHEAQAQAKIYKSQIAQSTPIEADSFRNLYLEFSKIKQPEHIDFRVQELQIQLSKSIQEQDINAVNSLQSAVLVPLVFTGIIEYLVF